MERSSAEAGDRTLPGAGAFAVAVAATRGAHASNDRFRAARSERRASGVDRKLALTPANGGRTGAWSRRRPWPYSPGLRDDRFVGLTCALTTASARKLPARGGA